MSQVIETLGSLRQIYRLVYIQPVARDDIEIIAKNYDKLSCKQIISILKSYKPLFNFEKPTSKITILKLELILEKKDYLNRKVIIHFALKVIVSIIHLKNSFRIKY